MGERSKIDEWDVVLIRQVDWPPFLPWCAFASRKIGNTVYVFNVEGANKADALRRVRFHLSRGRGVVSLAREAGEVTENGVERQ